MKNITDTTVESIKNGELQNELPEFYELKNVFENNSWHHETTFEHVLDVLNKYEKLISNTQFDYLDVKLDNNLKTNLLKVAILLHDISKNDTLQTADDSTTSFPGHEKDGAIKTKDILQRFNLTENEIDFITSIIKNHGRPHEILGDRENYIQLFNDLKNEIPNIYRETLLLAMADTMGSKLKQNNEENYNFRINSYKKILKLI
jgi:CRISPR/Cas system-associated endonuclease Cas3-HD